MRTDMLQLYQLIGNTPMVGIRYDYQGKKGTIYVKCEYYNFSGSIKDRMALRIFTEAYKTGVLRQGSVIVEATSGNMGISCAAIGRLLGHRVVIVMPDWMSVERKLIVKSFGAEIVPISKEQGGFTGSINFTKDMAAIDPNVFLPCQFANENNIKAHEDTTGQEIISQLKKAGLAVDAFVAGVGTGGTVVGVGRALHAKYPNVKVHPLEPAESPTMSTGYKVGTHRIQGISDEFIPDIMKCGDKMDEIIQVSDGDSILMAQKLANQLGIAVGISSGANFIGAVKLQEKYGFDSVVTTVFADDNKKYLSTDLTKEEPVKPEYLTPHIELENFIAIAR
ncbi:cysteine synthase [Bacteroidia bacterium]|nr:cysteine synthase [Bacteroidia bacterium]